MMKIHFNSFGDQVYIISTVYVNIYHLDILAQKKKFIIKRKGTQTNPNHPSPPTIQPTMVNKATFRTSYV
jgi:hypothetical protein